MLGRTRTSIALAASAALIALVAACGPGSNGASAPKPNAPPTKPFGITLTPASGTTNVPVSTEIGLTGLFGQVTSISLTPAAGAPVGGNLRPDGSSWVPDAPLQYSTAYQAKVTGHGPDGKPVTKTTSFTTMAQP